MTVSSNEKRAAHARSQTEQILRTEACAIHGEKAADLADKAGPELYRGLNQLGSAALCLSGGGIRSAAFSLGVIQALAVHPRSAAADEADAPPCEKAASCLLSRFHYLSTVSGGGYIGSWLSAWRSRSPFWDDRHPGDSIWTCLISRPSGSDQEPTALGWLRSYSNYLTPRRGFMSADSWTAVALSGRNLLLNWLVILPVFCALVLVLKIVAVGSDWATRLEPSCFKDGTGYVQGIFAAAGIGCLIASLAFATRNRPTRRAAHEPGAGQWQFIAQCLIPSFLSAALLAQFLASDCVGGGWLLYAGYVPKYSLSLMAAAGAAGGMIIYAISWLVARVPRDGKDFALWTAAGAAYGSLVALGQYGYIQIPEEGIVIGGQQLLSTYVFHLVFGWPWIILAQLTADMIFAGLASYQPDSDADREWQGRAAGWLVVIAVGWFVLAFSVFFGAIMGPRIIAPETQASLRSWATTLAALLGGVTAALGTSSLTPFKGESTSRSSALIKAVVSITAPLFVVALLIGLSFSLDQILFHETLVPQLFNSWPDDVASPAPAGKPDRLAALLLLFAGLAVSAVVAGIASRCININRFSLHALYRNRLIRAFLGASRGNRRPDAFTGFDVGDNPRMHQLWSEPEPRNWRPFHIVNIALNIVSSSRLSWQERKAEPFIVTPLHCGSGYLGFRDSKLYGDRHGLSLGTAMAISGAAASPNMGYNSSPAITFLMTMLNVRLGWWLGNPGAPGEATFRHEGPAWAIKPLVDEAFGLTTDQRGYVYLSDGGHFENLGLYEAVRRRCRFIIVVDAGCDPAFNFDDLGNAIRKIQIDQGVCIRLFNLERLPKRTADGSVASADYHAIGEIDYAAADGRQPGTGNGRILYIKAGYHGTESAGVRAYANSQPEFPHESTANQWFSESQFESYRALGFEITDGLLSRACAGAEFAPDGALAAIFDALWAARHGPVTPAADRREAVHGPQAGTRS